MAEVKVQNMKQIMEEKNKLMGARKMQNLYEEEEDTPEQLLSNTQLATEIYQQMNQMDLQKMHEYLLKIVSKRKTLRELFKFELDYYQPTKKCQDKNELKTAIFELLSRYQMKLDTGIEDEEWKVCTSNNIEYQIPQHEIWFENTVSFDKEDDDSLIDFLTKITAKIGNLHDAMKVKYKVIPHRNACVVLIKCIFKKKAKKKNKKKGNSTEKKSDEINE
jgi:hypothetical protein